MTFRHEDERQEAGHPEEGFAGVHGEESVEPKVLWGERDAKHGQGLRWAATAERPRKEPGEQEATGAGQGGERAETGEGVTEEGFGEPRLKGNQRAVVDVTPGEMAPAGNVVKLVAEVAVANVGLIEVGGQVEEEQGRGEDRREAQGGGKGLVRGANDDGAHGYEASIRDEAWESSNLFSDGVRVDLCA